jgi:hypothetical protein
LKRTHELELTVLPQSDDTTCGPTCLQALYRYYGEHFELGDLIRDVESLPGGGTLAVWLACHALEHGYSAEIYTYNLHLFDPTWFGDEVDLTFKLEAQARVKRDLRLLHATEGYLEFVRLGGTVQYQPLTGRLIRNILRREVPVLTGLSATHLYGCSREFENEYDDLRGEPTGHFVLLRGYDKRERKVSVADPLLDNPRFGAQYYDVTMDRLISSILLGILTHDANLLVIEPRER